ASQILMFEVAGRRLAIPVDDVSEIVRAVAVTPLPGAPAVVEGIIDLRGTLIPVLDLRARLGLTRRPVSPGDHFVVIRRVEQPLALRVDRVQSLVDLAEVGEVESLPEVAPSAEYVAGIIRLP